MLSDIKEMLQKKQSYMEAAEIILEDGMGNIDDSIVLGETKGEDIPMPDDKPEEKKENEGEEEEKDDTKGSEDGDHEEDDEVPEGDLENEPAEEGPKSDKPDDDPDEDITDDLAAADADDDGSKPKGDEDEDDLASASADDETPLPLPGDESLPDVIGRQTGEPPIDDPQDLLNVEVNMGTGTLKDVLPVPPKNADEAIAGDNPEQHVDAGFGDEGPEVPEPGEPSPQDEPKDDLLSADASDEGMGEAGKHVGMSGEGKKGLEDMIKNCDNQVSLSDLDDDDDDKKKGKAGKVMTEAISLGEDGAAQQPGADPNAAAPAAQPAAPAPTPAAEPAQPAADPNAAPAADANAAPEAPVDDTSLEDLAAEDPAATEQPAEPDNSVTAAVKDKVDEVSEPIENGREELFKRLSNLSKNLEDAKRILMTTQEV